MSGENLGVDLFGDPVIASREGPGRPEVVWSREASNKVLLAFARGLSMKSTSEIVGMSVPTLRKVFFSEVRARHLARLKLEISLLARLAEEVEKGNVSAVRELDRLIDKQRSRDQAQSMASEVPKQRAPQLGKKAAIEQAAREQQGLYQPPPPPTLN